MESINILCFGDSLTEGYSRYGSIWTPYADRMQERLSAAWPSTTIHVDVNGMSGDMVTKPGLFLRRIKESCTKTPTPYSWIIILGGTNDLGSGRPVEAIYAALQDLYAVSRAHGAKILALTVPECAVNQAVLNARRDALNKMILETEEDDFYAFDLRAEIPYRGMEEARREEIWDDGLHLTPRGYVVMGERIAERLVEIEAGIGERRRAVVNGKGEGEAGSEVVDVVVALKSRTTHQGDI